MRDLQLGYFNSFMAPGKLTFMNVIYKIFLVARWVVLSYIFVIFLLVLPVSVRVVQMLAYHFDPPTISFSQTQVATTEAENILFANQNTAKIFSAAELSHLQDVRQLFIWLMVAAGVLIESWWIVSERGAVSPFTYKIIAGGLFLLGIVAAVFFPFFFEAFHRVFFPQGNYEFAMNSFLIQTFPPEFWLLEWILWQVGAQVTMQLTRKFGILALRK